MPFITLLGGAALGGVVLAASALETASAPSAYTQPSLTVPAAPAANGTVVTLPSPGSSGTVVTLPAPGSSGTVVTLPAPGSSATAAYPTAPVVAESSPVPADVDYGAQAPAGGTAVAVSVHGNEAVAYVCDGHTVSQWFDGRAKAGTLNLTGARGARLTVSYRDAGAAGYITADGKRFAFSAPALIGRRYGLYEFTGIVHGTRIRAGWIVLRHGQPVGAVESDLDAAVPLVTPAPPLDLATATAQYDGVPLAATFVSGVADIGL